MRRLTLPILGVLVSLVCAQLAVSQNSSLKFTVPKGWVEEERSSTMRVAQFKLPRVAPDTEDASLVLYYFGQNQGGSITANIERWVGQMKQADGSDLSKEAIKEIHFDSNNLKLTTIDISGTYVAETAPGSGAFHNKPGYRLRAAVVETPNGSYYVKFVGPEKTVAQWNESFMSYIGSFEYK